MLALVHGGALILVPSIPFIAIGVWLNSNTISHNLIHLPFFRRRAWNLILSGYLSALLGIPQRLWRDRHLAHHAGIPWQLCFSPQLVWESILVAMVWSLMLCFAPGFFAGVYLPGYALGLTLCFLQGRYEHSRQTVSHYGRLYNWFFFNDGYHVEHHQHPGEHWTRLPQRGRQDPHSSRWPAVFRWLERLNLDSLERAVLRFPCLQRFVLKRHENAFRRLLEELPKIRRVGIVGGGIFPRTALVLQRLVPEAQITIIDASLKNIQTARAFLNGEVEFVHALYTGSHGLNMDLIVIPLSYIGDRRKIYQCPDYPPMVVHDWIWRRHKSSAVVSWALLKRINLVCR
jgi:hypothetical protein